MAWGEFTGQPALKYNFGINGNNGKYTGDGYYMKFAPYTTTLSDFRANLTQMKKDNYISQNTIGIIVTCTLYNPASNFYVSVMQVSTFYSNCSVACGAVRFAAHLRE
jgi:Polycystin cation channel